MESEYLTRTPGHAGQQETAVGARAGIAGVLDMILARLRALPDPSPAELDARLSAVSGLDAEARAALEPMAFAVGRNLDPDIVPLARDVFGAVVNEYQLCLALLQAGATSLRGTEAALDDCRVRLLRAGTDRLKWERCAGGPGHPALWSWLNSAFRQSGAREQGYALAPRMPAPPSGGAGVEREYLRAVALHCASLDHLAPELMAVVEKLVDFSLPMLDFRIDAPHGAICQVAPRQAGAPRRVIKSAESSDGTWFLSTKVALNALHELAQQIDQGVIPRAMSRHGKDVLLAAVRHLLNHWSDAPPARRYRRHVLSGKLTAVRGLEELRLLFSGESVAGQSEWEFRDVSRGGIGVSVPAQCAGGVGVGELVGIRPHDGQGWQFGIVRRAWRQVDASMIVGLESLSHKPMLARVDDGSARTDVFVCDPLLRGEAVRIAARSNAIRAGVPIYLTAHGSILKLKPLDAAMVGAGFELRAYQLL